MHHNYSDDGYMYLCSLVICLHVSHESTRAKARMCSIHLHKMPTFLNRRHLWLHGVHKDGEVFTHSSPKSCCPGM